jgi:hypothetical protein
VGREGSDPKDVWSSVTIALFGVTSVEKSEDE